ncbi:MAG: hypothetical protein ACR2IS_11160, partial [Nitrososphaeraceae archaeon]
DYTFMEGYDMMVNVIHYYYYIATASTAIAGILHLMLVPNMIGRNPNQEYFFLLREYPSYFG